jgi:hypothetical protein
MIVTSTGGRQANRTRVASLKFNPNDLVQNNEELLYDGILDMFSGQADGLVLAHTPVQLDLHQRDHEWLAPMMCNVVKSQFSLRNSLAFWTSSIYFKVLLIAL